MVAGAEAADGADALGEGADDEIDLLLDAGLIGKAAAMGAEHAEGMRLVDEQLEAVLLLDLDELRQRRPVAQHRIDALDNHQPAALSPSERVSRLSRSAASLWRKRTSLAPDSVQPS